MIAGALGYVWAAYGVAAAALTILIAVVVARLRYWAERAREFDKQ